MNFILTHIGQKNTPQYINNCIQQLKYFNQDVYFINENNYINSSKIQMFDNLSKKLYVKNNILQDFWIVTAKRFFIIEAFMNYFNLENVIHIENDVLIYEDFNKFEDIFKDKFQNKIGMCAVSNTHLSPGICYIHSVKELSVLTDYFLFELEMNLFKEEMISLRNFQKNESQIVKFLPSINYGSEYSDNLNEFNSCFDSGAYGMFVGGRHIPYRNKENKIPGKNSAPKNWFVGDELLNDNIKVFFKGKYPHIKDKNGREFKLNNLHIHCKKLYKYQIEKTEKVMIDIKSNDNFNNYELIDGDKFIELAKELNITYPPTENLDKVKNDKYIISHNIINCSCVYDKHSKKKYTYHLNYRDNDINWDDIDNKNLKMLFSENVNVSNEKIMPLPLGLERNIWHKKLEKRKVLEHIMTEDFDKKQLCYLNINTKTNRKAREHLYNLMQDKDWCVKEHGKNGMNNYKHFLTMLKTSKFVLCPDGNGMDSHRTWETLYCNSYPIVEKHAFTEYFAKYLPILVINNYDEITEEYLLDKYNEFKNKQWQYEYLDFDYWRRKIKEIVCG